MDDRNDIEVAWPWWQAILLFALIVLCAGTPDLLDAIIEVVRSWATCR